jgi:hypothetical protein
MVRMICEVGRLGREAHFWEQLQEGKNEEATLPQGTKVRNLRLLRGLWNQPAVFG